MKVGDIVTRSDGQHLRSGGEAYTRAVVIQQTPLVLVSCGADMRWQHTIQDVAFDVIGEADKDQLERCMRRLPQ